jgi:tRNA-splicing ligase RtcB
MVEYNSWGSQIDDEAHKQMQNACKLPISVAGALMPDAHVGYGLPIGGVLATDNAVIPYAVGVDIACRVMISVLDTPLPEYERNLENHRKVLEENTAFGIGANWKRRKSHPVMDEDWKGTELLKSLKDKAWDQLGTSGSGNHFVEFGELQVNENYKDLKKGNYLALVSHSGSRGSGARIADYYSKLARSLHPELPKELAHLSWLDMDKEGAEYWHAMELMGKYASANHHVIHRDVVKALKAETIFRVENHHNYAWKENHSGKDLVVHRKGATPAGADELGYIPGSMAAPGYLIEGKGEKTSLNSCSHGAGRAMSRKKAKETTTRHALKKLMRESGIELLSAGLDESPHAYKDIEEVMRAQNKLVKVLGKFSPKMVKMAPDGERAED